MALTEAEQAVVDHLSAEPGADPATVGFRRTRAFPGCQLHEVEFRTRAGQPRTSLVRTWQDPDGGWQVSRLGGGGGGHPYRSRPWVNFAAALGTEMFAAGGEVIGDGAAQAALVRLTFADGTAFEDQVAGGVVLFFAGHGIACPALVEIRSSEGAVLASYEEFTEFA